MLSNLSIKNYALIDVLNVKFNEGFTCITGETGAGKSILLGGLSLVLGKRADLSNLRNKEEKCVIEAEFKISQYNLEAFFKSNDLDYEPLTIVRREILPSGKSRAFINDSPVTLNIVSDLGERLIDIHSQHQTLQLGENEFQYRVIDALAGNGKDLTSYTTELKALNNLKKELQELLDIQNNANKELDYNSFLLKELEDAHLKAGMQEALEEEYEELNNVENITELLSKGQQLLTDEQIGIVNLMAELKQTASKLGVFGVKYADLSERINSVYIEADDIASEIDALQEAIDGDPERLAIVNTKLQLLYDLQKKHSVQEVTELLEIQQDLSDKVAITANVADKLAQIEKGIEAQQKVVATIAAKLTKKRSAIIPGLKKQINEHLTNLGMASATFKIEVNETKTFNSLGKDELVFLFSANKGGNYGALKKVASGGELSRIMLTIKAILAKYENLPTMMFDEIDTGVSGEISNKMGDIMQAMSTSMQVFTITHLPQVAAKGNFHYKVFKQEKNNTTNTQMRELTADERINELAEMLGGKNVTDSALIHAKQLLEH